MLKTKRQVYSLKISANYNNKIRNNNNDYNNHGQRPQ